MLLDGRDTERRGDIYMIVYKTKGEWKKTFNFFSFLSNRKYLKKLEKYGEMGVESLMKNTPKDSGKTSESWSYRIEEGSDGISIVWTNSNFNHYVNIAVILQYGHGTGTGGYVQGIDYINPALKPIFEEIANKAWKEVTSA